METLLKDIRYAARMLRKSPGFAIIAVLTLALGIGANSALFSVVNGVLLNPLPYPEPDRLVSLSFNTTQFQQGSISYLNFLDWQKDNHTFSALAAYRPDDFKLITGGESERLHGHMISAGFFALLQTPLVLGREFRSEEDQVGANRVMILSEGLWKRRFAASPDVIGKSLSIDGNSYTVVGVANGNNAFMRPSEVFVPIGQWDDATFRERRVAMGSYAIGRLKPGVTLEQARADMAAVSRNLAAAYPEVNANTSARLVSLKQDIVGDIRPFLLVLVGAVGFVLLIACTNVGNLLLARSAVRSREFAIRFAIGASQKRVVTQLLTESVLLALIGGCLGIAFANWATHAVLALVPATVPRADEVRLDAHVLIFTIAVSIVTGILFGLAPALKMLRPDLQGTLKGAERGSTGSHHRTQNAFVVFETALALVLLIAAGLMLRTMRALWTSDPGFDPSHVLTLSFTLSAAKTSNAAQLRESQRELLGRYESLPEVESAAIIGGSLPMSGDSELPFWLVGQPKPASDSQMNWALFYGVSPKYWNAMRIPLLRGRVFTDQDNERSPNVLVVDEEFARRVFPNQDPIGKRINLGLFETQPEIIGVVGHVNHWGLGNTAHENLKSELYLPVDQFPDKFAPLIARGLSIVVRTRTNPELLADPVRRITSQFDSQAVVYDFASMEHIVSNSVASQRFAMTLLGIFAALALVLASVGIYGVLSYLVGQRTQEVGIRMALGAQRGDVLRLILGQGTKMALIGVAIGMVVALVLTRLMGSMLYGVSATDPLTYLTVAAMLVIVATLACGVPAWRASNVDPMVALRYE